MQKLCFILVFIFLSVAIAKAQEYTNDTLWQANENKHSMDMQIQKTILS